MGEAILVGRGGVGSSGGGYKFVTEMITKTTNTWHVPEALENKFSVRIFEPEPAII